MPTATIQTSGDRGPADSTAAHTHPQDCVVRATLAGERYLESRVQLEFDSRPFLNTTQPLFGSFCRFVQGKPYRKWFDAALEPDITQLELNLPISVSTREQNVLKACFLAYLWLEPTFVSHTPNTLSDALLDDVIVDYSGQPGQQNFLYFPPVDVQSASPQILDALYRLGVVSRMRIEMDVSFRRACMNRFEPHGIVGCRFTILWRTADEHQTGVRASCPFGGFATAI